MLRNIFLFIFLTLIVAGCATTSPQYSIQTSYANGAYAFKDLIGHYKGIGIVKKANGDYSTTFKADMMGYKEDGVIFMRETYSYQDGREAEFTYRITEPGKGAHRYGCIRIETLDKCTITEAGSNIALNIRTTINNNGISEGRDHTANLFHFLGDNRLLKHAVINRFLFAEEMSEIIHYTKVY